MTHRPLVYLKNVSKSYTLAHGVVHALKAINLEIHCGESVAIRGPSGSGKSTLLQLIGCLDRPTAGHYRWRDQDVSHLNDQELACVRASQMGFVFQSFNLIPQLTVFENVEVPFLYQPVRLAKEVIHQRILTSLERVKLLHRLYHLPSQLSGGESQRVAIARALAIHPLLILADEPTGNLDRETGQVILQLFEELNAQGVTLVIVTHDEQMAAHCQRVVHLVDGCLVSSQKR